MLPQGGDFIQEIKEWTIMLYANGNNELEPEIWNIFLDIKANIRNLNNSNIVLQMSREPVKYVKILRPDLASYSENQRWEYTRRYVYKKDHFELIEDLGNLNMADSTRLYEFILWATEQFPARRYLLSFGGHVYQFVGLMFDYSQNKPCIAGFPQLASAIEKACHEQNIVIDILLLDTCYASTVEVIYEFGKSVKGYIKYLLTYIETGPISGLVYSKLINVVEADHQLSTEELLRKIIDIMCKYQKISLIAFKLDSKILQLLKRLFSDLAYTYLLCEKNLKKPLTPYELVTDFNPAYPWAAFLAYLSKIIKMIVFEYRDNRKLKNQSLPVHILYKKIPDDHRKNLYRRLSFCQKNYWYNLICSFPINKSLIYEDISLAPVEINKNILYTVISTTNGKLSEMENKSIVKKLIEAKGWKIQ